MTSSTNPRQSSASHRTRREARIARIRAGARLIGRRVATLAPATALALTLAALNLAPAAAAAGAQDTERFGERLSRMPVDLRTTSTISGAGAVTAELAGNELTITIRFSGLSSGVTAAHVHNAPVARRGGVAFAVDVGGATGTAGQITDTVTLTDEQLAELRAERYYVQIHTENNPGGELRGWLLRHDD